MNNQIDIYELLDHKKTYEVLGIKWGAPHGTKHKKYITTLNPMTQEIRKEFRSCIYG